MQVLLSEMQGAQEPGASEAMMHIAVFGAKVVPPLIDMLQSDKPDAVFLALEGLHFCTVLDLTPETRQAMRESAAPLVTSDTYAIATMARMLTERLDELSRPRGDSPQDEQR